MTTLAQTAPVSDIDLFTDDLLAEPYDAYRTLRDAGPAVWLERYETYALPRFASTHAALADDATFISGEGVTMNAIMNRNLKGGTLCSDGEAHMAMRRVIMKPLTPVELKKLTQMIQQQADELVGRLIDAGRFDGVTDFAQHLPVTIVAELVGLPAEGRDQMLRWAAANFNCLGPMGKRTEEALEIVKEMIHYAFTECVPGKLKPDGWAQGIWDAADRGEIPRENCPSMMNDYMGPALDTTIAAASNLIVQFAENPDQWDLLRDNPALLPNAINEGVRLDSPILKFGRYVARDTELCGVRLPEGSRVLVMYASANRDERKWEDPDRFDIRRKVTDHVGFGFGAHQCVGNNLARMEVTALFRALIPHVRRFHVGQRSRAINNTLRLYSSLDVSVERG